MSNILHGIMTVIGIVLAIAVILAFVIHLACAVSCYVELSHHNYIQLIESVEQSDNLEAKSLFKYYYRDGMISVCESRTIYDVANGQIRQDKIQKILPP